MITEPRGGRKRARTNSGNDSDSSTASKSSNYGTRMRTRRNSSPSIIPMSDIEEEDNGSEYNNDDDDYEPPPNKISQSEPELSPLIGQRRNRTSNSTSEKQIISIRRPSPTIIPQRYEIISSIYDKLSVIITIKIKLKLQIDFIPPLFCITCRTPPVTETINSDKRQNEIGCELVLDGLMRENRVHKTTIKNLEGEIANLKEALPPRNPVALTEGIPYFVFI